MKAGQWLSLVMLMGGCVDGEVKQTQTSQELSGDAGFVDAGSPPRVMHMNWSGTSVMVQQWDPYTGAMTAVFVGAGNGSVVSLNFGIAQPDPQYPWMQSMLHFGGAVPASAFTSTKSSAHLAVTVTGGPGVFMTRCRFDPYYGYYTCGPATDTISLDLTWRANGQFTTFQNGITKIQTIGMTEDTHGAYRQTSSDVNGTVGGATFSNVPGQMNDSKGNTVMRDVTFQAP